MYPYPKWINDRNEAVAKLNHLLSNIAGENCTNIPGLSESIGMRRASLGAVIRRGHLSRICATALIERTHDDAIKAELQNFIK